jgi:hypothetical protein
MTHRMPRAKRRRLNFETLIENPETTYAFLSPYCWALNPAYAYLSKFGKMIKVLEQSEQFSVPFLCRTGEAGSSIGYALTCHAR